MKTIYLSLISIIAMSQVFAQNETSKRAVESVTLKASAGDVRGLIDALPNLELLWQDDPVAYLEAVKIDVQALIKSGNPDAKNAVLSAFPNLISKTCPADTGAAASYVRIKYTTITNYFAFDEIRSDKGHLLMIATFLGEVRSLRIPDYQNQGTNMPGREILNKAGVHEVADLPTQALKDAVAAEVKKNEEDMKMNELQGFLSSADSGLTSLLTTYAKEFPVKDPANREFHAKLAERSKLTEKEIEALNKPK